MTPRQMYREVCKLTRIVGTDGETLLSTRRLGSQGLGDLANAVLCLLEKLNSERARHDFRYYYDHPRPRSRRSSSRPTINGSTEEEPVTRSDIRGPRLFEIHRDNMPEELRGPAPVPEQNTGSSLSRMARDLQALQDQRIYATYSDQMFTIPDSFRIDPAPEEEQQR